MTDETMLGTGRINQTGGSATITMPKVVLDKWEIDENGADVVWFADGDKLYAVPRSLVTMEEN